MILPPDAPSEPICRSRTVNPDENAELPSILTKKTRRWGKNRLRGAFMLHRGFVIQKADTALAVPIAS
jgi:hypothetical protein